MTDIFMYLWNTNLVNKLSKLRTIGIEVGVRVIDGVVWKSFPGRLVAMNIERLPERALAGLVANGRCGDHRHSTQGSQAQLTAVLKCNRIKGQWEMLSIHYAKNSYCPCLNNIYVCIYIQSWNFTFKTTMISRCFINNTAEWLTPRTSYNKPCLRTSLRLETKPRFSRADGSKLRKDLLSCWQS